MSIKFIGEKSEKNKIECFVSKLQVANERAFAVQKKRKNSHHQRKNSLSQKLIILKLHSAVSVFHLTQKELICSVLPAVSTPSLIIANDSTMQLTRVILIWMHAKQIYMQYQTCDLTIASIMRFTCFIECQHIALAKRSCEVELEAWRRF